MLEFAHMGIGLKATRLVRPFYPAIPVLLGTTLPDLIDKPLYYGASLLTGRISNDIGLISCTRTFGHSGLFLAFFAITGVFARNRKAQTLLICIAWGILTHHGLDFFSDAFFTEKSLSESAEMLAFFFPFYRDHFAGMPTSSVGEHLLVSVTQVPLILGELLGVTLLFLEWRRSKAKASSR